MQSTAVDARIVPVFGSPAGNSRSGGVGLTRSSTLPIPDWTVEMNSLPIIGKSNKLRVIDLADWGLGRIFARFQVKLDKPSLFWDHSGEPYKTA